MGLDIVTYRHATLVHATPVWLESFEERADKENLVFIFSGAPEFNARLDDQPPGYYAYEEEFHFAADSYGGYNKWREWLSFLFLGVLPSRVWDHYDQFRGKPFVELIHFSDCEGAIGPLTSAKLAQDFERGRDRLPSHDFELQRHISHYDNFQRAFQIASEGGFVSFR